MTKILLVRHGHVEGISPERFRGRADLPLTPEGRRQAEATARRVAASWRPAAIYSSPLQRCIATASAIARPFDLTPSPLDGLIDIDYGKWQGLTPDEAAAGWPDQHANWRQRPDWAAIPDGETLHDVLGRTVAALRQVVRECPAETAIVVGHDTINRVILLYVLGLPLSAYWRLHQHPCAINEFDCDERGFTVIAVNQADHLIAAPSGG